MNLTKKILSHKTSAMMLTLTVVLMLTFIAPLQVFAASMIAIDDGTGNSAPYTSAANGTGFNGGTWIWDGADNLALDNYNGSEIYSDGDLRINVTGANTVANTEDDSDYTNAIEVHDGDLTIAGDGSIDVTAENTDPDNYYTEGISLSNGDVTIDGVAATITSTASADSVSAIAVNKGDVNIINGAKVTAASTNNGDGWSRGIISWNGDVNIADSTVNSTGTTEGPDVSMGNGIESYGYTDNSDPAHIGAVNITNSTVTASGTSNAIVSYTDAESSGGTINLNNSMIIVPSGGYVEDCAYTIYDYYYNGQTIGTGSGTITDTNSVDAAKSVFIDTKQPEIPIADTDNTVIEPVSAKTSTAAARTLKSGIGAATGDSTYEQAIPYAAIMISALTVACVILLKRRKLHQDSIN